MKVKSLVLALSGLGLIAGCSNYYQVRDPQSGNVYYTRLVRDRVGGAVSFEDALTGRDVTLQQSEVMRIDDDMYEARTAHVVHDHDVDVVDVQPAAARTQPQPDRQVEIRKYHDPDESVDVKVVPEGEDVHIDIDR